MKLITKRFVTIHFFLIFLLSIIYAQDHDVTVSCKRNNNNGYDFSYKKNLEGSYVIIVKLNGAENVSETEYESVVSRSSGHLFSVDPVDNTRYVTFMNFSLNSLRGVPNPKIDTTFIYAMPFRNGGPLFVTRMSDFREKFFSKIPSRKLSSFSFSSKSQDTVCAVRKGIVVSIDDSVSGNKNTTNKTGSVLIEQPDGTLTSYSGFKNGSIFVKVGQTVFPFMPLGLLSHSDTKKAFILGLNIRFLGDSKKGISGNDEFKQVISRGYYEYLNPYFLNDKAVCRLQGSMEYSPVISNFIIEQEMTKKELKAIGKKNRTESDLKKLP